MQDEAGRKGSTYGLARAIQAFATLADCTCFEAAVKIKHSVGLWVGRSIEIPKATSTWKRHNGGTIDIPGGPRVEEANG